MGPFGIIDVVGMKTAFDIPDHWGHQNGDKQMLANAEYIKTNFLDKRRMALRPDTGITAIPTPPSRLRSFSRCPTRRPCRTSSRAPS